MTSDNIQNSYLKLSKRSTPAKMPTSSRSIGKNSESFYRKEENNQISILNEFGEVELVIDETGKNTPYRWVILALYSTICFIFCGFYIYLNPVSEVMKYAFDVDNQMLNQTTTIQNLACAPFSFFNIYLAEKIGIKRSLLLGMFFCTLGCGIDILMCYNFYYIYAGQLM